MDFCAHSHKDSRNMDGGATMVTSLTAYFSNMRTLKFKTQPTVLFFNAAIILGDVSGNKDV